MEADELNDGLALFAVELQAGEQGVGELDAGGDVILVAAGLAGVVQEQGEQEEVEAVDLRRSWARRCSYSLAGWRRPWTLSMVRKVCSSTV